MGKQNLDARFRRRLCWLTDDAVDVAGQEGGLETARQGVEDHTKRLQQSRHGVARLGMVGPPVSLTDWTNEGTINGLKREQFVAKGGLSTS